MQIVSEPSFFRTNRTGTLHGEWLGRIRPLSINSLSCGFISFSSVGAKRYGAREIGAVLRINSMQNSISRSGGSPGRSSGKTDKYCRTIGTSSGTDSRSFVLSTMLAKYHWHPLSSNCLAQSVEIVGAIRLRGVPWNSNDFAFGGLKRTRFLWQSIIA